MKTLFFALASLAMVTTASAQANGNGNGNGNGNIGNNNGNGWQVGNGNGNGYIGNNNGNAPGWQSIQAPQTTQQAPVVVVPPLPPMFGIDE